MILVDTSIWVDHLRSNNPVLSGLLDANRVLTHPRIVEKLALGNLRQRETVLRAVSNLPHAKAPNDAEVLRFIDGSVLFGRGICDVDVHLLASTRLTIGAALWTRDRRLNDTAAALWLVFDSRTRAE